MRIAVIGAGIAGLGAAWHLSQTEDVVVFEADARLGGHANTVDVAPGPGEGPKPVAIDTGFIVYNTANYPNLIALFEHIGVETAPTNMSFAVSLAGGGYEYSGSGVRGLFGQPSNALSPAHWQMTRDILRFFRDAEALAALSDPTRARTDGPSLGDWLAQRAYSPAFIERHIVPMGAAIWSTPASDMLAFPAAAFARFFSNHGLLKVRNRPQWRTVEGGSRRYVAKLTEAISGELRTSAPVRSVRRENGRVLVTSDGHEDEVFDACVLACHADQALALITDACDVERSVLSQFAYAPNTAYLHRDASLMPRRRRLWSSWNYIAPERDDQLVVSYWMNCLQPLPTTTDWFVTLNPPRAPATEHTATVVAYRHPVFDGRAMRAQEKLWALQGRRATWFCGSYFGFGFHEDALQSGLAAAENVSGRARPWTLPGMNDRLLLGGLQCPLDRPSLPTAEVAVP
ncbi:MAG: NAD(P)/FAD-dependent oxidoreductase [Hyphomicrobiaceae bacterium]